MLALFEINAIIASATNPLTRAEVEMGNMQQYMVFTMQVLPFLKTNNAINWSFITIWLKINGIFVFFYHKCAAIEKKTFSKFLNHFYFQPPT